MYTRLEYKSCWDIIDALLRVGVVLYGPGVTNLLYPSKDIPYEKDNLIRAHYYSDCVDDIDAVDIIMANLGYIEIVETSTKPYSESKWHYTTYEINPNIELQFTAPRLRVSVRPYISYSITVVDSLCLVYDEEDNEYRFFYSGAYLYHQDKWSLIHDISCLGYIRVRTLRSRRLLPNGRLRVIHDEFKIEHTRDKVILHRGNKYVIFRKDNPYLR